MKRHQLFLIVCIATFGLAMICGCATSAPKESEAFWKPIPHFKEPTLFEQVRIKLRKLQRQGDPNVGFTLGEDGTLHILYPDVVYVEWRESKRPDGTIQRRIGHYLTAYNETISEQLHNGEIPEGIKIVDYDSGGMDVYEFLGIKRPN